MVETCFSQNDNEIQVWQMTNGKITQMKIQGGIFIVKPDATVNPIKAAKDFLATFDIGRTTIVRKAMGNGVTNTSVPSTTEQQVVPKRKRMHETGEIVGKINNLPIIKEKIIGFYRKYPDQFTTKNMAGYFFDEYKYNVMPGTHVPTDSTIMNKQRATLKFLVNKGYVKQIEGKGNYKRKYEWKEVPYGAEPAAQADVSSKYLMDLRKRELISLREG